MKTKSAYNYEDNKLKIIFRTKGFRSKNNPIVFANLMVKDNDGVLVGFGEPYNPNVVSKDDIKERLCIRMVGYLGYIGVQRLVIIDCKQKLN